MDTIKIANAVQQKQADINQGQEEYSITFGKEGIAHTHEVHWGSAQKNDPDRESRRQIIFLPLRS